MIYSVIAYTVMYGAGAIACWSLYRDLKKLAAILRG